MTTDNFRVGLGFDSHRIESGGTMILGGVPIECDAHLVGHSDADALLHAITDAILSAAGLDDIGQLFPNTDPSNKNRDSGEMLAFAVEAVRREGYRVVNIDCVVHSEKPKVSAYKLAMRMRIAELLGVSIDRVGLKGKTGERSGEIGAGRLMEVHCVALLTR